MASQIAVGRENDLKIEVYGEKAGLVWSQYEANTLEVYHLDKAKEVYRTGAGYLSEAATANTRTPGNHPEGYLEAFANVYRNFSDAILCHAQGIEPTEIQNDYPKIDDGIRGMAFIEAVVASSQGNASWTKLS